MTKKVFLVFFTSLIFSCQSDENSNAQVLPVSESLIGAWTLVNYYSDVFRAEEQTGRIEQIVAEETSYEIEFTDSPTKIILTGFLRYSVEEYEIIDGEKVTTSEATNFMDAEHNEGYHVTDWRVENKVLITEDPTGDGGDPFISKSAIVVSGNTLKLTLDSAQFNPKNSGDIILEYKRK